LAVQLLDACIAELFIQMQDYFGVRLGSKSRPFVFQFMFQLEVIENLTVEDNTKRAIRGLHRLAAACQVDDT